MISKYYSLKLNAVKALFIFADYFRASDGFCN